MSLLRQIRSLWDYYLFFEIKISQHPLTLILLHILSFILFFLNFFMSEGVWFINVILGFVIILAVPIVRALISRLGTNRVNSLEFSENKQLLDLSDELKPSRKDSLQGFENFTKKSGFESSVHLSNKINQKTFQKPDWDCKINFDTNSARQKSIISNIRLNSRYFRRYGRQITLEQLFKKPLINEEKVGLHSDITTDMSSIDLFSTDYYSTLCASDSALIDFTEVHEGKRQVINRARGRAPFNFLNSPKTLNPISAEKPPMTNQIGVNLLGVTKDNFFAICVQSRHALRSPGKRAPLASGSADVNDYVEGDSIKAFIERAVLRELREEWGNNKERKVSQSLDAVSLMHLGMFRIPRRGGKPEFCVLAKLNWTVAELTPDQSEVEKYLAVSDGESDGVEFYTDTLDSLSKAVTLLLDHAGAVEDSASLYGSLLCLRSAINASSSSVISILES